MCKIKCDFCWGFASANTYATVNVNIYSKTYVTLVRSWLIYLGHVHVYIYKHVCTPFLIQNRAADRSHDVKSVIHSDTDLMTVTHVVILLVFSESIAMGSSVEFVA